MYYSIINSNTSRKLLFTLLNYQNALLSFHSNGHVVPIFVRFFFYFFHYSLFYQCFFLYPADILRFGGSAQSHLIYHPSSFFPRSAMLNVTVDVLGASINVLETAARFEGFEVLIEQFFGEDGYLPDDRIMKMFNLKPHEERDKEEKTVNKAPRGRRSLGIHEDINRVEKHLNKLHRTVSVSR